MHTPGKESNKSKIIFAVQTRQRKFYGLDDLPAGRRRGCSREEGSKRQLHVSVVLHRLVDVLDTLTHIVSGEVNLLHAAVYDESPG